MTNTALHLNEVDYISPNAFYVENKGYVHSLASFFNNLIRNSGRILYMVSTTYIPHKDPNLELSANSVNSYFKQFHGFLLEELCGSRRYNRPWFMKIEPIIFAFLDAPGTKRKKCVRVNSASRNSELHHHCIFAVHEAHEPFFDGLVDTSKADSFVQKYYTRVRTLHVEPIGTSSSDIIKTVDYCSKYFRDDPDDVSRLMVFPKARSEYAKFVNPKEIQYAQTHINA